MPPPSKLTAQYSRGTRSIAVSAKDQSHDLTELLRRADLPLNTRCGRRGLCDGCLVELLAGTLVHAASGRPVAATAMSPPLRACQYEMPAEGSAEIRIPTRSLLAHEPQVVTSFRLNVTRAYEPLWQRVSVDTAELNRDVPLAEAVCQAASRRLDKSAPLRPDPGLESVDPQSQESISLVVEYRGDHWSLRPLATASELKAFGIAVDIGTTTVVVMLVDLDTGQVSATASALNAQTYLGDNVLTRISLCLADKGKIGELQEAVAEKTIAPLLDRVLTEAGAFAEQVVSFSIAGNTTMLHLLAGVDPSSMGMAPFTPSFLEHRMIRFRQLPITTLCRVSEQPELPSESGKQLVADVGRTFETEPTVHLLPGAAAYVGADVTAGIFSSGMAYRSGPCLLVDVGTNGEIVLKRDDHLIACATAAGPAFEGAGLNCGVRAGNGAISHVRLDGDPLRPQIEIIGGGKPIGLCGTAYVDFVAQARRHGLIGQFGRITQAWADSDLIHVLEHGRGFLIAHGQGGEPIVISEADIASLLQAKAAIAAGIICLLSRFGMTSDDVVTLYLAGGFGFHMDVDNLIGCGLLPGMRPSQIQVVGNTSLAGAYLALLDAGVIEEIKRISASMELVELNLEPRFESCYIDQLRLP